MEVVCVRILMGQLGLVWEYNSYISDLMKLKHVLPVR